MTSLFVYPRPIVFNDPESSDFRITVGDHLYYCHGTVLYTECRKLYYIGRENQTKFGLAVIHLDNIDPLVFSELLKFIYFKKCDNHLKYFANLERLALEFELPELTRYLSETIDCVAVTIENFGEILQVCIETSNTNIKCKVLNFISDNFIEVLNSPSFLAIDKSAMQEILKVDRVCGLFSGELNVFDAVLNYADFQLKNYSGEIVNRRTFLTDEIIQLIRFPTMTISEFQGCMKREPIILSDAVKNDILIELEGGKPNDYGFSNVSRLQEIILNHSETRLFPCIKNVDTFSCRRAYGFVPKNQTIFHVNQSVGLSSVWLYRLDNKSVDMFVKLKNKSGQILACGEVRNAKSYQTTVTHQIVSLSPRIQLVPLKDYILEIDYSEQGEVEFYGNQQNFITSIDEYNKTFDYLTVVFGEINKMLVSLSF